jgi:CHAT domain-containing protein
MRLYLNCMKPILKFLLFLFLLNSSHSLCAQNLSLKVDTFISANASTIEVSLIKNDAEFPSLIKSFVDSIEASQLIDISKNQLILNFSQFVTELLLKKYISDNKIFTVNHFNKDSIFDLTICRGLYVILEGQLRKGNLSNRNEIESFCTDIFEIFKNKNTPQIIFYLNFIKIKLGYLNVNNFSDFRKYYDTAIESLNKIESGELYFNRFYFYHEYANHLYGIERDLEAAEHFMQFLFNQEQINVKSNGFLGLIRIYTDKNDGERALEYCLKMLNFEDSLSFVNKTMLYQTLSILYIEKADYQRAEQYYVKSNTCISSLKTKEPKNTFIKYLEHESLSISYFLAQKQGKELALDNIFENAQKMGYSQYRYLDAAIKMLSKKGLIHDIEKLDEQLSQFKTVFRENRWNAVVITAFAEAYNKAGKYHKAIEKTDAALQLIAVSDKHDFLLESISEKRLGLLIYKEKFKAQSSLYGADSSISLEMLRLSALKASILMDQLRLQIITKGSKELLLNEATAIYESAIQISNELFEKTKQASYLEEAFVYAEKSKAIMLMDALKETDALKFGGVPDSIIQKEQSLNKDINFYSAEKLKAEQAEDSTKTALFNSYLFDKRTELNLIKSKLEKKYPNYYELKYNADVCNLKSLQKALKRKNIELIEYVLGEKQLYIFHICQDSIKLYRENIREDFYQNFAELKNQLTDVEALRKNSSIVFDKVNHLSQKFYSLLLGAAFQENPPKRLLIVPDGQLSYLPFETLIIRTDSGNSVNFAKADYLLKYSDISYAYSATLWLQNSRKEGYRGANTKILAMAPIYEEFKIEPNDNEKELLRSKLKNIKGAEEEVKQLQKKFSGNFCINESATESNFKANAAEYSVLHLAMHGLIDDKNSAYSGLYFSKSNDSTNDNILFAYEIPSLNISAEMVVLSACQTGYGKYQNGEGVISLGRSFMYAGAKSVVMTLWEVNDESGKILMSSFYDYLGKGLPKDRALAQAKLDYLKKAEGLYAHPYFWSNFVLIGDSAPISIKKALRPQTIYIYLVGIGLTVLLAGILMWFRR